MITLYRHKKDPKADTIEQRLKDLVLAYRSEITDHMEAPFIKDSGNTIAGEKELEKWFVELEAELSWQRSLSGDGCYIDPQTGETC